MARSHHCHDSSGSQYSQILYYAGLSLELQRRVPQYCAAHWQEVTLNLPVMRQANWVSPLWWRQEYWRCQNDGAGDDANWLPAILNIPKAAGLRAQLLEPAARRLRQLVQSLHPYIRQWPHA